MTTKRIISIDPGYIALGYTMGVIDLAKLNQIAITKESTHRELFNQCVTWKKAATYDLGKMTQHCSRSDCKLNHGSYLIDKSDHLWLEIKDDVESSDFVVIEAQSPGFDGIQNLLMSHFPRKKLRLIYPNSRNLFFQFGETERMERKSMITKRMMFDETYQNSTILRNLWHKDNINVTNLANSKWDKVVEMMHDSADAAGMLEMFCVNEFIEHELKTKKRNLATTFAIESGCDIIDWNMFMYKG